MSIFVNYLHTAATMLDCDVRNLPEKVEDELNELNILCEMAGGTLVSRQIIAQVIYKYNKEN